MTTLQKINPQNIEKKARGDPNFLLYKMKRLRPIEVGINCWGSVRLKNSSVFTFL